MTDKAPKPIVVMSPLGPQRDARDHKWRPSVALCRSPETLLVERLELLYQPGHAEVARQVQEDIAAVSPATTVRLHRWDLCDPWDFQEVYALLHAFAGRYPFQPDEECYLVHMTTGTYVMQICLFLLVARRYFPAQLVNTIPPELAKGPTRVIDIDLASYEHIVEGLRRERQEQMQVLAGDVSWGPTFRTLLDRVISVSLNYRGPMLLTGPTGSGKSFLARHIYELKKKRNLVTGEFMEINCATLQRERACSDLFGHQKGAFTGAHTSWKGLILQANNGILFLDEISELESEAQAMLLTVLDTGQFLPVSSDRHEKVRFELITATNRDLRQAVRGGRFREDLYHRISALRFELPGLDGRRDDIEPFIDFALREYVRERYDEALIRMHPEARDIYLRFALQAEWPGNLRQLKHSVMRMAARAQDGTITRSIAEEIVSELRAEEEGSAGEEDDGLLRLLVEPERVEVLDNIERMQLAHVLRVCRRSPSLAAAGRILFDKSRQKKTTRNDTHRLSQYLHKYGLDWGKICAAPRGSASSTLTGG